MKTNKHLKLGVQGERLAESHLRRNGYQILTRNYRYKRFEIDLIVQKEDWTVFVEVKTRSNQYFGHPESFINEHKIDCLQKASAHYRSVHSGKYWRYDIVAVIVSGNVTRIRHIEDALWI